VLTSATWREHARRFRHHGTGGRYHDLERGWSNRLDEMLAALLRVNATRLAEWTERHRAMAARCQEHLAGLPLVLPVERGGARHVYHLFTVRHGSPARLAKIRADLGVGTAVHYPVPMPEQPMYEAMVRGTERRWPVAARVGREVLSLRCFAERTDDEVDQVADAVRLACDRV
jgi:dTDP-4-amino-4,6-dideoxygalactose transaminase